MKPKPRMYKPVIRVRYEFEGGTPGLSNAVGEFLTDLPSDRSAQATRS